MQIKIILISILVSSSYLIGQYIYKSYIKRHKQLHELIRVLEIIRMDLSFGLYTLEEIFNRLGENKENSFAQFFKQIGYDLNTSIDLTLEEIINKNTSDISKCTYLEEQEVEELKKLILTLGKSDIYSQERMIELSIENIKKLTLESKDDINKKGLVYRKLSTIIGLVIGIFLI